MLRITVHEQDAAWRLQLEGKLAGAWVPEAENIWRSALGNSAPGNSAPDNSAPDNSAPVGGRSIEVDLTGVTAVDDAGERLLQEMHQAGARLKAQGVEMKE